MGTVVLDAGVMIGLIDPRDSHHAAITNELRSAVGRRDRLVLPASAYAEILVRPSMHGAGAVARIDEGLDRLGAAVHPLGRATARAAAVVRAQHRGVKLPDALIIATAAELDADTLLTTDGRWPSSSELGIRAQIVTV